MLAAFTAWMFRFRTPLVIGFAVLTAVMAWFAAHLRVDASFNKSLPLEHEYIQTFTRYQREFGGANRALVALMVREGESTQQSELIVAENWLETLRGK